MAELCEHFVHHGLDGIDDGIKRHILLEGFITEGNLCNTSSAGLGADGDADGEVLGFPENVPYLELLQILHGAGPLALSLVSDEPPEEIPLADGADVLSVPADDGDGGVAMVPHLFQSLPERVVVIEVRDAFFGKQEISDIHETAPFLEDGKPACIWLFGLYS